MTPNIPAPARHFGAGVILCLAAAVPAAAQQSIDLEALRQHQLAERSAEASPPSPRPAPAAPAETGDAPRGGSWLDRWRFDMTEDALAERTATLLAERARDALAETCAMIERLGLDLDEAARQTCATAPGNTTEGR